MREPTAAGRWRGLVAVVILVTGAFVATATQASADVYSNTSVEPGTVPGLAAFDGGIGACWVDGAGVLSVIDNVGFVGATGDGVTDGCSVAGFGGNLYVAWTDPSGQVELATTGPDTGAVENPVALYNVTSNHAPALAADGNDLYIAWTGTNGQLNVRDITTTTQATFESSSRGPALNAYNGHLVISWIGSTNSHINVAELNGGGPGEACKQTLTNENTSMTPGLTNWNGSMYLSWTGQDSAHHINLLKDQSTSNVCDFADSAGVLGTAYEANTTPGLSPENSGLEIVWGGLDKNGVGNGNSLNINAS